MPIELGALSNAEFLKDAIQTLCIRLGFGEAWVRLLSEFSDGFSDTRVVLGEVSQSPDDPHPSLLVFKIGPGRLLRDEVARYLGLIQHARAPAAFAAIKNAAHMQQALSDDDVAAAICYEHAAASHGAADCMPFRKLFREGVKGARPIEEVETVIDSLGRVLQSLYGSPATSCYASEAATYYLERWAPDFRITVDRIDRLGNRPLLTLQRLNAAHFRREPATDSASLRRAAEMPQAGLLEVVLPSCTVAGVYGEKLVAYAPSVADLSLEIDLHAFSGQQQGSLAVGDAIAVWAPARSSRYAFYQERIRAAFGSFDTAGPVFDAGPLRLRQPLAQLSQALRAVLARQKIWKVPGHGDLHGGNVLVAGSMPVIIDYGRAEASIPSGVDAARLIGSLVRDVLSELLSSSDLVAVVAESLGIGTFVAPGNTPAARALRLITRLTARLLPSNDSTLQELWPAHLYGFSWISLKWPGSEAAHRASYLLAAVALHRMLGPPEPHLAAGSPPTIGGGSRMIESQGDAEILVLVARFSGSADYDPTTRIYAALCDHLLQVAPRLARVERIDEVVSSRKEASDLAAKYRASMIVWGIFDNLGIQPWYQITRDSQVLKRSMIQLDQATRSKLSEGFERYITHNLAAEISFLSLAAIGDMCVLNLNYETAISVYTRALTLIKDEERARQLDVARIHYGLAAVFVELRRYAEAREANGKLLALSPDHLLGEIQRVLIEARSQKKTLAEGLEDLRQSLQRRSEADQVDALERSKLQAALALLAKLRSPQDVVSLAGVGEGAASEAHQEDRNQYSQDAMLHLKRALSALWEQKLAPCLSAVEQVLRINPRCADAFVVRASILALHDRAREALAELEAAEKLDATLGDIHAVRASILYQSRKESLAAVQQFELGFERGSSKERFLSAWGSSMIDQGRGAEVMQYLRDNESRLGGVSPQFFEVRSHYHRSLGQNEQALRDAEQAVALSANNADMSTAIFARAQVYASMQLPQQELRDLEHIRLLIPGGTLLAREVQERITALRSSAGTTSS